MSCSLTFATGALCASIEPITTTFAPTAAMSGAMFPVAIAAASYTVSLPAVATSAGVRFTFIVSANATTHAVTIAAPANTMQGGAMTGPHTGVVSIAQAAGTNMIFGTAAAIGDMISCWCDGTSWFTWGFSGANSAANTITVS